MKRKNFSRRYQAEYNWYRLFTQFLAVSFICYPFWILFYKIKIQGRENIPKGKKVVLAANHISYFDPFLVFLATLRPVAFMAKKELFEFKENPTFLRKLGDIARVWWLDALGAFSVNREKLEVSTIKTAKDALKTKRWTLGIFPQGGIRKNKKIENINKGFVVLAKMVGVDILPIGITGCETYSWNILKKPTITVNIGKPISINQDLDVILDEWGRSVAQLCNYEYVLPAECVVE